VKGFLFDENVPGKLKFRPSLPIIACSTLGDRPSDTVIWEHARSNQLVIVSKDSDFSNRIIVTAPPPWVVHLRFGNLRRREFHEFLAKVWPEVEKLLPDHKLINVYIDRIEGIR
jgi:predicted nuclease of predicted toxin-antitoxin system